MRFTLDISLDNASAEDARNSMEPQEVLTFLRDCYVSPSGKIMDPDGNTIGSAHFVGMGAPRRAMGESR